MPAEIAQQGVGQYTAREVSVLLQGNTGAYQQQMGQAAEATTSVADALLQVEKVFKRVFGAVAKTGIGIGATMQGMAATSAMMAAQFENSFARVAKTTGLMNESWEMIAAMGFGERSLAALGEEIRDISTEIPVAVGELSALADIAGQLGAEDVALFASTAAKLGATTQMGSDQAIVALSQLIQIFGDTEDHVEGLGSALAELGNRTAAFEGNVTAFATRVAGAANAVGLLSEETLGWGAAITASGTRVELGATAFQEALIRMQRAVSTGGRELERFASVLDMTAEELQTAFRADPSQVMLRFVQALADAGDDAAVILQRLQMTGMGMTQTFLTAAGAIDEVENALRTATNAAAEGSKGLDELADAIFGTFLQQFRIFRQSLAEAWRSIGMGFLPIMQQVMKGLTSMVNLFNSLPQFVKSGMGAFLAFGGVLATVLGTILLFITSWHGLIFLLAAAPKLISWVTRGLSGLAGSKMAATKSAVALTASMRGLTTQMMAMGGATAVAGRGMLTFSGIIGGLAKAVSALVTLFIGKGTVFLFKEFGTALANVSKAGVGPLLTSFKALLPVLGKVALLVGAVAGAWWTISRVMEEGKVSAEGTASAMEDLARATDMTYNALGRLGDNAKDARDSMFDLAIEAKNLIRILDEVDRETAEALLFQWGMELIAHGSSPEEVEDLMKRLQFLTGRPYIIDVDFSADTENFKRQLADAEGAIERVMQVAGRRNFWDLLFRRPDQSARQQITTELDVIAQMIEKENIPGAMAAALDFSGAIRQALEDGLITNDEARFFTGELRRVLETAFDENFGEWWEILTPRAGDIVDVNALQRAVEHVLEAPHLQKMPGVDEMREQFEAVEGQLHRMSQEDLEPLVSKLRDLAALTNEVEEISSNLPEHFTRLGRLWGERDIEFEGDDTQLRRWRESVIQTLVDIEGHSGALRVLNEHFEHLVDTGREFSEEGHLVSQALERIGKEWTDMRVRDLEREINALPAAQQVKRLNDELEKLDQTQPGTREIHIRLVEMREQALGSMESELSNVLDQRDRMLEQVASMEENHQRRIQDMRRSRNERLAEMEENHQRQVQDMRENHNRRLTDMDESHQRRSAEAERSHNQRIQDMRRDHHERLDQLAKDRDQRLVQERERYGQRLKEIAEQERQALRQREQDIARAFSPMERTFSQRTVSLEGAIFNIDLQNEIMREMNEGLRTLQSMGLSRDVIDAMGLTDPSNWAQVKRFVENAIGDPSMIDAINREWSTRLDVAKGLAEHSREEITDQYAQMRRDAKEQHAKANAEITQNHREAVNAQIESHRRQVARATEDYERQVAQAAEEHKRQVARAGEEHARQVTRAIDEHERQVSRAEEQHRKQVARAIEDHERQVASVEEQMAQLGQSAGDSLEDLIQRGYDSNIEGIKAMAAELEREMDRFNQFLRDPLSWHGRPAGGGPTRQERALLAGIGITTDPSRLRGTPTGTGPALEVFGGRQGLRDAEQQGRELGETAVGGFRSGFHATWPRTDQSARESVSGTMGGINTDIQTGMRTSDRELSKYQGLYSTAFDHARTAGTTGAQQTNDAIAAKLTEGVRNAGGILGGYATTLSDSLNPIMEALGKPKITVSARGAGIGPSGQSLSTVFRAMGGPIPGDGMRDSVTIHAMPGEWVIRKDSAQGYGDEAMSAVNEGRAQILTDGSYQHGGMVTAEGGEDNRNFSRSTSWSMRTGDRSISRSHEWAPVTSRVQNNTSNFFPSTAASGSPTGPISGQTPVAHVVDNNFSTPGFQKGGKVSQFSAEQLNRAKIWGMSQQGKPYQWGGVGPGGYDCSGFWSALVNKIYGRRPHQRQFATASFAGSRGPVGFVPGSGSVTVGVIQRRGGTPGHMSGDITGLPLESRSSDGVVVGPGARGAFDPLYTRQFQLGGGVYLGSDGIVWDLPKPPQVPRDQDVARTAHHSAQAIYEMAKEWVEENTFTSNYGIGDVEGGTGASSNRLRQMARDAMASFGWGPEHWPALNNLVREESSWNPTAQNPTSTAFGLFQFLNSTWRSTGISKTADPARQITAGLRYIRDRYRNPTRAWQHWLRRVPINGRDVGNWYAEGGPVMPNGESADTEAFHTWLMDQPLAGLHDGGLVMPRAFPHDGVTGLQRGGVVTQHGVFEMAERGREAVLPLESTSGRAALADAMAQALERATIGGESIVQKFGPISVQPANYREFKKELETDARRRKAGGGV